MFFKTKPIRSYFLFTLVSSLLLYCLNGCKKEAPKIDNQSEQMASDTVLNWISEGQNKSLSLSERRKISNKALEHATLRKNDSIKLNYFLKLQWSFLNLEDSLRFRQMNRQARMLSITLKDSVRLGFTHWDLADFLSRIKVKDSAYYHFSSAQKIFNALGDNSRAGRLTYDMALIQMEVKDYDGSEFNTVKAIKLLKPLKENLMLYRCYNLLGILAKDLKEFDLSLEYYTIAENYLKKSSARGSIEVQVINNLGVNYLEKGEYANAISYFERALNQDSLLLKNPKSYARTLNNLARSQYMLNSDVNVEGLFSRSLKIRDSIDDITGLAGGSYEFAEYYLEKKDTAKALENVKKTKEYAQESSNNERLLQSLELLTKLDPANASSYSQEYIALNDSLLQEERKLRNKFARIRFETDEVVAENQMLAREKQLWAGIAISILLLGTAGYVIIDQRLKNQKLRFQQEQQASDEKIFNLMLSEKQKFEEGKKIEQKRISEELHDGILGKMLGARMVLTGLNKKADQEAITERAEAIIVLKDVEGEVRTISHELSHAAYQEIHNFIRSIRDLLHNTGKSADISHTFNYDDEISWDDLHGDIKINVYRMVQESLQNAVKHAKCKNVIVDFSVSDNQLQVLVRDDGIGFDFSKRKRGIGMRNIQARTQKLKGSWHIDSKSGVGTMVKLNIPIQYFSQEPQVFEKFERTEKV